MYRAVGAKRTRAAVALLAVLLLAPLSADAGARTVKGLGVPAGYSVRHRSLGTGVDWFTLGKRGSQWVNVARLAPNAPYRLRPVLASNSVSTRVERTTSMCRRVRCVAAVNGDFFDGGMPVGAVVVDGEPMRSARTSRPQLVVAGDGGGAIVEGFALAGRFIARYPRMVVSPLPLMPPEVREERVTIPIAGVNVPRGKDAIVMYTPRYAARTGTRGGAELVVRLTSGTKRPAVARWTAARAVAFRWKGNEAIPRDGVVLSATGAGAKRLDALWKDIRAGRALTDGWVVADATEAPHHTLAGNPVVLADRADAYPANSRSSLVRSRHPRTLVAWTSKGELLLVTIDGRQRGRAVGMTLREAASLLRTMGAVDALNLDGGGSTTFVVRGKVGNVPSGGHGTAAGRERSVATALAIVPK